MKKVIRLTESDLTRIVKRVIKENENEEYLEKIKTLIDNEHFDTALQLGQTLNLENEVIDLIIDNIIEKKFWMFTEVFFRFQYISPYLTVNHPKFRPTLSNFIKTNPDFKMVLDQIDPNLRQKKYKEIYSKMREKYISHTKIKRN